MVKKEILSAGDVGYAILTGKPTFSSKTVT